MRKTVLAIILLSTIGYASDYYAKLNPINTYTIKSSVSGKVIYVNDKIEAKVSNNNTIIKIDSKVDEISLKQSKIKLQNLQETLKIQKNILKSYQKISSKSKFDKDNQRITILNISSSISDLETTIATLEDQIAKKTLTENNNYIYDIAVEVGDYVTPGVLLYSSMDFSAGKLEIYIPISSANEITDKKIFLDGEETDLKISKLYEVADATHISSYKCEIIIPKPKQFSNLVKIEFK
jgi:TfoX/Sxy family transcriptional regulator of competence genes